METKQQLQAIIDNAPDMRGIEYDELFHCNSALCTPIFVYTNEGSLHTFEGGRWHKQKEKYNLGDFTNIRQLSDIQNQVKLMERIEEFELEGWVSVNDRLPEFYGCYLVAGTDIEGGLNYFCPEFGWKDDYEITHWMSIPQLPTRE